MVKFKTRERLTGRALSLTIQGIDYWYEIAKWDLEPSDKDNDAVTFGDLHNGTASKWTLKLDGVISFEEGSFFEACNSLAGKTVPVILAPLGNKTAAAGKPHYCFNATFPAHIPGLGNEVSNKPTGKTFSIVLNVEGQPERKFIDSTAGTDNPEDSE